MLIRFFAVAILSVCVTPAAWAAPDFEKDVRPVFAAKCVGCHGAAPQGKLDLRSEASVLRGGASGRVVTPGASAKSLLLDKLVTRQMPPGPAKLTDREIDVIRNWVDHGTAAPAEPVEVVKEREVLAILQARCMVCHGGLEKSGGLDLRTVESRLKGGKSGPALVPGKPEQSLMYTRVAKGEMPPAALAKDLAVELPTDAETAKIKAWIAAGAPRPEPVQSDSLVQEKDRKFWAFQPPVRPAVPQVKNKALVRNPLDAFLLRSLEARQLSYSPEASPLTLLRRLYVDLTGTLPTPAEVRAFQNDRAPDAYERLVDRLLASPRYGERWGQHWLDLAGYSDSEGFGQDDGVRPFAWRYRDYVIRSLNADKPYDRFLTEQLAGDELSEDWKKANGVGTQDMIDRLAATGFLRLTPDQTNSNERALIAERMNIVADELEVLASSVMGLTVGCARCHNHKYDPIPQRDYYRLSAILQAAYNPYEWKPPQRRQFDLALESERQAMEAHNAPIDAGIKKLRAQLEKLAAEYRKPGEKTPVRELEKQSKEFAAKAKPLNEELQKLRGRMMPKPHVRILTDNAEPSVSYLLRRGDPVSFGEVVEAGVPAVLENAALVKYEAQPPFAGASGRRLALARWLTQPNHPLTARVAVNQVWARHFGRGIVPTVSNFGRSGLPPSHPELLDWLATEFVREGWSMKKLHRLIVTSRAYRQTSQVSEALLAADAENALLSRMPLMRMDAETLYDAMMTATGKLDSTMFGKPQDIEVRPDKEVVVKQARTGYRRAVYVLHRRQTPLSLLDAFDQPAMTPNCTERRRSNVATQALHLFNGTMAWEVARYMAGRVMDEAGADAGEQVTAVYLRAYSRPPTAEEVEIGRKAIAAFARQWPARLEADGSDGPRAAQASWLALANYCHAVLNSAEFGFVD